MKTLISIISLIFFATVTSGCGYDGHYRYPCQDPANFGQEECIPPLCEVTGQCTSDLLGFDPTSENVGSEIETADTTSDIIEEDNSAQAQEPENVDSINDMVSDISEGN